MNNLNEQMQARLDKWRKNTLDIHASKKLVSEKTSRRNGKNDYGDVSSLDELEEEARRSQTRK